MITFQPFPELFSERLFMRQLTEQDESRIFELRSDPGINTYLERPLQTRTEEALAFIDKINSLISENQSLYWAVCLKGETELMGTLCLWNFSPDGKKAEIGYELLPAFQGKGYMQEALHQLIAFAFQKLKLETLEAYTHKDNKASTRLIEKSGFQPDAGQTDPENPHHLIYVLKNTS